MGIEVGDGMHGSRYVVVPGVGPGFQPLPLIESILSPYFLVAGVGLVGARYCCTKVGDLGYDIEHAMSPDFFPSVVDLAGEVHVYAPFIGTPGDLPVEVKAAKYFQANVQPEAGSADTLGSCIPATFFD